MEQTSIKSVDSDNSKEGISIIDLNEQLCIDCDMDYLPKISMSTVYPQFYEQWMISNKAHFDVEAHFINEDWATEELTQELIEFHPNVNIDTPPINSFESICKHIFPSGREFTNYRQLD